MPYGYPRFRIWRPITHRIVTASPKWSEPPHDYSLLPIFPRTVEFVTAARNISYRIRAGHAASPSVTCFNYDTWVVTLRMLTGSLSGESTVITLAHVEDGQWMDNESQLNLVTKTAQNSGVKTTSE
jgi:hypothetical protein